MFRFTQPGETIGLSSPAQGNGFRFTRPGDTIAPAATATGTPATPAAPQYNTTGVPSGESGGRFGGGLAGGDLSGGGLGQIFSRMSSKTGAPSIGGRGDNANPNQAGYARMDQPGRSALLQSMLTRARGGQPGGAPTAPLPAPGSTIPTA